MEKVFRIYDIRGTYPDYINESIAYDLGRAFVSFLNCRRVVVGRDIRLSTPNLYQALVKGIMDSGCDVYNIGIVSSPICYFANSYLDADGSIMITGSHHPKEYNGFKLCAKNAVPISQISGLTTLKRIMDNKQFINAQREGALYDRNIDSEYYNSFLPLLKIKPLQKFKIVCDYSNSVGIVELYGIRSKIEIIPLNDKADGNFPNHDPDPSVRDNIKDLSRKVRDNDAVFGVGLDGDADRVVFVDENGKIISSDIIIALISKELLKEGSKSILYDLRSSKMVKEVIEKNSGKAIRSRVGHAFVKDGMRNNSAAFGGELSGHYYFSGNSFSESSLLAIIHMLNIVARSDKPLSKIVHEISSYHKSEEIILDIGDIERVLEKLEVFYYKGVADHLDGLTLDFGDWWFNVRASNTENLMRLNIEAKTPQLLDEKKYELLKIIEKITAHEI